MKIAKLKMLILFCVIVVGSLMGEGYNVSSQPYRYGGKELVTLGGLNLSDFGARWLDSPSGTFTTMDPLCEDFQHLSPYLYCAGNPIKYIDPSGMVAESVWDLVILGYDLYSAVDNHIKGDHKAAINNWVDATADIVALLTPGLPAGVTKIDDGINAVKDIEKLDSKYKNIPNPKNAGEGKKTTQAQRKKILEENRRINNGELKSDGDGRKLNPPSKNQKGKPADMNQAEVDHIIPRSKGGTNENSNLRVISKEENLKKGNR